MEIDIDFDDSIKQWRKNKKSLGNGKFVYICNYIHSNGKQCRNTIYSNVIENNFVHNFKDDNYYKNTNHINSDFFCKKHLNCQRCKFIK